MVQETPDIYQFLDSHHISWQRYDHPAVYTCEEAMTMVPDMDAANTKNLFLKDKKGRRHFLVSVGYEKNVDLKGLARLLGVGNLSFASPDRLKTHLGVEPGSVTLLAIIQDRQGAVEVVIDKELWANDAFACHPLVNTATLVISKAHMENFFTAANHSYAVVSVPERAMP